MDNTILVVERIVIEALNKKAMNFERLMEQTALSEHLLQAILGQLIQKGIVLYKHWDYQLNWELKDKWLPLVTDKEGTKAEIKELFASLVNHIYEQEGCSKLKVQKIYLNNREKEELDRKLSDIDSFIQGIRNQRAAYPVKENISQQQVVFYGKSEYRALVNDILNVG